MRSEVQILSGPPLSKQIGLGALAQLGEHLLCKQGVIGSIPIGSTSQSLRATGLQAMKHTPEMKRNGSDRKIGYAGFARGSLTL